MNKLRQYFKKIKEEPQKQQETTKDILDTLLTTTKQEPSISPQNTMTLS